MENKVNRSLAKELLGVQRTLGWMDLVIGSITDAVYVTDVNSRLIFANQFFSDLLGTERVLLFGQQLEDVFPVLETNESAEDFLSRTSSGVKLESENIGIYLWHNKDRTYVFKISSKLIPTTNQTVYLAQDITKEHELFRLKNTFINLASHQLRTPMTAIMTYSHMLHDGYGGDLDPRQKELTQHIINGSERMIKLINDILHITRIQNEETDTKGQEVLLPDIITMIETEVHTRITDKKLSFKKIIPSHLPTILCTKPIMYETLSNVIVNAVQYTPEGGDIKVVVSSNDDACMVTVRDNGIGIPEKDLPRIFDQFSRADNALEIFDEGTGLGLYLVKILMTRIGGTVDCKSKLNKGTTFTLSFPVSR